MSTEEELLIEADDHNLITKEKPLRAGKGRIKGNRIAIQKGLTEAEKKCVLAEELGHWIRLLSPIESRNYADESWHTTGS